MKSYKEFEEFRANFIWRDWLRELIKKLVLRACPDLNPPLAWDYILTRLGERAGMVLATLICEMRHVDKHVVYRHEMYPAIFNEKYAVSAMWNKSQYKMTTPFIIVEVAAALGIDEYINYRIDFANDSIIEFIKDSHVLSEWTVDRIHESTLYWDAEGVGRLVKAILTTMFTHPEIKAKALLAMEKELQEPDNWEEFSPTARDRAEAIDREFQANLREINTALLTTTQQE